MKRLSSFSESSPDDHGSMPDNSSGTRRIEPMLPEQEAAERPCRQRDMQIARRVRQAADKERRGTQTAPSRTTSALPDTLIFLFGSVLAGAGASVPFDDPRPPRTDCRNVITPTSWVTSQDRVEVTREPIDDAPLAVVDLRKQRQAHQGSRRRRRCSATDPRCAELAAGWRRVQRHVMKRRADIVRLHPRDQLAALFEARQQHVVEVTVVGAGIGHERRAQPAIPERLQRIVIGAPGGRGGRP